LQTWRKTMPAEVRQTPVAALGQRFRFHLLQMLSAACATGLAVLGLGFGCCPLAGCFFFCCGS
jgi:hypothetical protein